METLESLSAELDALSRTAERRFRAQPRSTRNKLTAETRAIFQKYAEHGNQARLRHNVRAFLETGDEGMTFAGTTRQRPSAQAIATLPNLQNASRSSKRQERGGAGGPNGESRTVDADSAQLAAAPPDGLDFHLDRSFVLDADTTVPEGLLESMDRVFGLYAKEAKLLLSHHCEKYGNEAVFRAGIREFVMSRTDTLFQSISRHDLGLTPETQEFLFSVYERHPDLNVAETRMLVRATRVDEDSIELFWDDMTQRRKSYLAMRQLVAARELRELRKEKEQELS